MDSFKTKVFEHLWPSSETLNWLQKWEIEEVECLVPDLSGVARGKILPIKKFLSGWNEMSLRIPEAVFSQAVTGDYAINTNLPATSRDLALIPDQTTLRLVPWQIETRTAMVICDCYEITPFRPITFAPRYVLKRVIELFDKRGWQPIVAPELEFYLVGINPDPDYDLEPPVSLLGIPDRGRQAYGIEAANGYDHVIEDVYSFAEQQLIRIDSVMHESGAAQIEFNMPHDEPLTIADQVFFLKRTIRTAAQKHKMFATFMAKPHQDQPGSAMHIHQSVINKQTDQNLFSTAGGASSIRLKHYLGGLQRLTPSLMPLFAPNINSYRRLQPDTDAPLTVHWGGDNRTVGFRVPHAFALNRRIENRVCGADVNPYLALAGTLAGGLLGLKERIIPRPALVDRPKRSLALPRHMLDGISRFCNNRNLKNLLGEDFVTLYAAVKTYEYTLYLEVISSWEREHLLLNV